MKAKIGIIGLGNMGSALSRQLKNCGWEVYGFDKDGQKAQSEVSAINKGSIELLMQEVSVAVIAIKPQDFGPFLESIKKTEGLLKKLLISIAAGVSTSVIEDALMPQEVRVVRLMPNLFATDGESVSGICKGRFATNGDLSFAEEILKCLGAVRLVSENMMDAVTAVSGSGPGYLAYLIKDDEPQGRIKRLEELIPRYKKAARDIGFNDEEVEFFAAGTGKALISYFKRHSDKESAKRLCEKVTSKGGTTEAAIKVLEKMGEGSLSQAVQAAKDKAEKLTKDLSSIIKEG